MRKFLSIFLMLTMLGCWGYSLATQAAMDTINSIVDLNQGKVSSISDNTKNFAESALGTTGGTPNLQKIVANAIKFVLALLGMVMMVIVIYAGFLWMTAGGADEKILTAKKYLKNGLIGLVLIFAAYAIADFAVSNLANITSNTSS